MEAADIDPDVEAKDKFDKVSEHGGLTTINKDVHTSGEEYAPPMEGQAYDAAHMGHEKFLGLSGNNLGIAIAVCAGVGFTLFGYDQGVMGSMLTLVPFLHRFPYMDARNHSTLQGATVGIYEIGCFLGSISCMIWGNTLGRRKMIWIGSVFMVVGAVIQTIGAGSDWRPMVMLWIGRIIGGIGNGQHTSTIPVWQSECSSPHRRGMLIMIEGTLITFGIMISYWVDFALYFAYNPEGRSRGDLPKNISDSVTVPDVQNVSWQFPLAFQIVLCLPTFLTIWLPESPRWLILRGREEEARKVLSALKEVPRRNPAVNAHLSEIKTGLSIAKDVRLRDLLKQGKGHYFHRASLAFVIQMFQQITGINLITYYAGTIFQTELGLSATESRILAACNGTEYFLASLVAIIAIERVGRQKLMIFTALGQAFTMVVLTGILSQTALDYPTEDGERIKSEAKNKGYAVGGAVLLFVFNTFFGIGWLGMTWLYPAECTPLSIRAQANGLSTCANWLFNFMVVMITPIAFDNIDNYTYLIFAIINLLMAPASWWIFPETAGRSLEEMDEIFAQSSAWDPHDVVVKERQYPRRYDQHGELKLDYVLEHADGNEEKTVSTTDSPEMHGKHG